MADSPDKEPLSPLANDLIWGAGAIGEYLGVNRRKAFYLLERGLVPGKKIGGCWVSRKTELAAAL